MKPPRDADVRAVILAGVHPWDDEGLDAILPRPLLPVLNRPLIEFVFNWLKSAELRDATVCTNRRTRSVRRLAGDGRVLGMNIDYYEDWMPRGPAGCVRDAVADHSAATLVIADGTILPRIPLERLLRFHFERRAAATVVVHEVGRERGEPAGFRPVGIYVLRREVLDLVPEVGYQDIKEMLIPRLRTCGQDVCGLPIRDGCYRVTDRVSYLTANALELLSAEVTSLVEQGYRQMGDAWVHETARIAPGAVLVGPAMIGPRARIARGVTLVGPCVLGPGVHLRERSVVCRSVLWECCDIGRHAMVDRSVVTRGAWLADGQEVFNSVCSSPAHRSSLRRSVRVGAA